MVEGGDDGEVGGVDEVVVVGEDVDVDVDGLVFLVGDEVEGFGVEGVGVVDCFFEEVGDEDFCFGWVVDFEGGGGYGGEFGCDVEDVVEGVVGVGDC